MSLPADACLEIKAKSHPAGARSWPAKLTYEQLLADDTDGYRIAVSGERGQAKFVSPKAAIESIQGRSQEASKKPDANETVNWKQVLDKLRVSMDAIHAALATSKASSLEPSPVTTVIDEVINEGRQLLDFEDDWDGEGSRQPSSIAFGAAEKFLADYGKAVSRLDDIEQHEIEILPTRTGAISIDWRTPKRELLLTIPVGEDDPITYYGDDGNGGDKIKGILSRGKLHRWFAAWLADE